jgi:hypothetical protein
MASDDYHRGVENHAGRTMCRSADEWMCKWSKEDQARFTYKPEEKLKGKWILVTGKLIDYKGKAEIVVTNPSQIGLRSLLIRIASKAIEL